MKPEAPGPSRYEFENFQLDVGDRRLLRDGKEFYVQPKVLDTLAHLVERAGHLVSKAELLDAVWPDTVVTENSLTRCILELRKILDDDAAAPTFIQTVPRRGYKFIAPVAPVSETVETNPLASNQPAAERSARPLIFSALAVVALAMTGLALWDRATVDPMSDNINSIAVLPFENVSNDPGAQYFSDGISEEILNTLAQIPGMRVAARASSFSFRDRKTDLADIATQLGVRHILDGSVRTVDNRVRITAQLIEPDTGKAVWSQSFDRTLTDVFAVQDEIAASVLTRMQVTLSAKVISHPTEDIQAYQYYLLGRDYSNRRTPLWWRSAAQNLRAAVERDPEFAAAYGLLGVAYLLTPRTEMPGRESRALSKAAIDRALELDSNVADGQAALGLYLQLSGDLVGSEKALRQALAINPSHVQARYWLATTLGELQRWEEARLEMEVALAVDPLNPIVLSNTALGLWRSGRPDEARPLLERARSLPELSYPPHLQLVMMEWDLGNLSTAMDLRFQMLDEFPDRFRSGIAASIGLDYGRLGFFELADQWVEYGISVRSDLHSRRLSMELAALKNDLPTLRAVLEPMARRWKPMPPTAADFEVQLGLGYMSGYLANHEQVIELLEPARVDGELLPLQMYRMLTYDAMHMLALAYETQGRLDDMEQVLDQTLATLQSRKEGGQVGNSLSASTEARHYAVTGDVEKCVSMLEQAVDLGWRGYYEVLTDPRWDKVRNQPDFQSLMLRVKEKIDVERDRVPIRPPPTSADSELIADGVGRSSP